MTKPPKDDETKFNETLKRMLSSPPAPRKPDPDSLNMTAVRRSRLSKKPKKGAK